MRLRLTLLLCFFLGILAQTRLYAQENSGTKKKAKHSVAHKKASSFKKHSNNGATAHHSSKKGKKHKGKKGVALAPKDKAPTEMIAQNKEKIRISDSVHNSYIQLDNKEIEEGYFAGMFSKQKKLASFETLEGTASVFKSVSGWEDKKFYVLTNQLPIGTIVRITTSDLKSICAKVISSLPDVSNSIQYRLSDAAVAILGITNKTFKISVTY
jgi:hypothetical protein